MNSAFTPSRMAASFGILVVFLVGWEWGPGILGVQTYIIPPLSAVVEGLMDLFRADKLWFHIWITTIEVVLGFVLGSLLGMIGGYALGLSVTATMLTWRFLRLSRRKRRDAEAGAPASAQTQADAAR